MVKNLTLRQFSDDQFILDKVFYHNCYRLKKLPKSDEVRVIIDIGAHIGIFTLVGLYGGYNKFYCFEPFIENYKVLLKNLEPYDFYSVFNSEVFNTYQLACCRKDWGFNNLIINYPETNKLLNFSNIETENKSKNNCIVPCDNLDNILKNYLSNSIKVKLLKINIGEWEDNILLNCNILSEKVDNICGEIFIDEGFNISEFQEKMKQKGYLKSFVIKNDLQENNSFLFWFSKTDISECFDLEFIKKT